jgi:predicted anti-sigma-YlaC factor YlaD
MKDCQALDLLITPYVDGEASERDRQVIAEHVAGCASCHHRVEAESTARHLLRAHAAVAKTLGEAPPWRPRAVRLGRPPLLATVRPAVLSAAAAMVAVAAVLLFRPASVSATGVIGDSHCGLTHRYTVQNGGDDAACTVRCVEHGAKFVLLSGDQVFSIANQDFPNLARFANERVALTGTRSDDGFTITHMNSTE